MGSARPSSGASQNKDRVTNTRASTSQATSARKMPSGQVITYRSSSALMCGEVRRVTNATRSGSLRLSDPTVARNGFGSSIGFRFLSFPFAAVQPTVLADAPKVYRDEKKGY